MESNGHNYVIKFTVNALCAYEDRFQNDIATVVTSPSVTNLRGALWAGLISEQPDTTLDDAGDIIDGYMSNDKALGDVVALILQALTDAGFFKKAGNAKNPAKKTTKK